MTTVTSCSRLSPLINSLAEVDRIISTLASKYGFDAAEGRKVVAASVIEGAWTWCNTPIAAPGGEPVTKPVTEPIAAAAPAPDASAPAAAASPKRAPAAFDLWAKENRTTIRKDLPTGTTSAAVNKALRAAWNNDISDDAKSPFVTESQRLRIAAKPPAAPGTKKVRQKKDPNAPKGPQNAYMRFAGSVRAQIKAELETARDDPAVAVSVGDVAKVTGAQWKILDADTKALHEQAAAADKERYVKEKTAYDEDILGTMTYDE